MPQPFRLHVAYLLNGACFLRQSTCRRNEFPFRRTCHRSERIALKLGSQFFHPLLSIANSRRRFLKLRKCINRAARPKFSTGSAQESKLTERCKMAQIEGRAGTVLFSQRETRSVEASHQRDPSGREMPPPAPIGLLQLGPNAALD